MSRKLGVVFGVEDIPPFYWYQWVPEELVPSELSSSGPWFAEQAMCAIRDGGKAVWVWSQ